MARRKKRLSDRYDGWKLKATKSDLFFCLIPHIMRSRLDSQCFFEERIDLEPIESLLRELRSQGHKNIKTYHVFMACLVRTVSQRPRINRFVAGRNIYARNHINLSIAIKRSMSVDGEETIIKPMFEPDDTLLEVAQKVSDCYEQSAQSDGDIDKFVSVLCGMPNFVRRFIVFLARNLDKMGLMPKALHEISPFHSTAFITDVGSLGIASIHHHLYEFGTTSVFLSLGKKEKRLVIAGDGSVKEKRYINLKVVVDERICDGFYYGSAFKYFVRLTQHPERLLEKPEQIVEDDY